MAARAFGRTPVGQRAGARTFHRHAAVGWRPRAAGQQRRRGRLDLGARLLSVQFFQRRLASLNGSLASSPIRERERKKRESYVFIYLFICILILILTLIVIFNYIHNYN